MSNFHNTILNTKDNRTVTVEDKTVYTQDEVDNLLAIKVNVDDVYSKKQITKLLNEKADVSSLEEFVTRDELRSKADLELIGQLGVTGFKNNSNVTEIFKEVKKILDSKASRDEFVIIKDKTDSNNTAIGNIRDTGLNGNTVADQLKQLRIRFDGIYRHSCRHSFSGGGGSIVDSSIIGDLTTTGLDGKSVAEQLKSTKELLDTKADKITIGDLSSTGLVDNTTVSGSLKELNGKFDSYYTKAETYNKDEIEGKLSRKLNVTALDSYSNTEAMTAAINAKCSEVTSLLEGKITANAKSIQTLNTNKAEKSELQTLNTKIEGNTTTISGIREELNNKYKELNGYFKSLDDKKADKTALAELAEEVQLIQGAAVLVCILEETKEDVEAKGDGKEDFLNQKVVESGKGDAPKEGYEIKTSDGYTYRYNNNKWNLLNTPSIGAATTNSLGLVKFLDEEGYITTGKGDGTALVSGYSGLKANVTEISGKIGNLTDTGLANTTSISESLKELKGITDTIKESTVSDERIRAIEESVSNNADAIETKLNAATYNSEKTDFASKTNDIGTLSTTGVEGDKVADQIKNLKTELNSKFENVDLESLKDSISNMEGSISNKANKTDVYTKIESDGKFAAKSLEAKVGDLVMTSGLTGSTVTAILNNAGSKINAKLDASEYTNEKSNFVTKADLANKVDSDQIYIKSVIDQKLSAKLDLGTYITDKAGFATKEDLNGKVNSGDVYTKSEVDGKLDEKLSISDYNRDKSTFLTDASLTEIKGDISKNKSDISTLTGKIDDKLDTKTFNDTISKYAKTEEITSLISAVEEKADANTGAIQTINNKLSALNNPMEYIGQIDKSSAEIDIDKSNILNAFVQEKLQSEPKAGFYVVSNDNVSYVYDSKDWDKLGTAGGLSVGNATTDEAGIVKLKDEFGYLVADAAADGTVKVKGIETLALKTDVTQEIETAKQALTLEINKKANTEDVYTKVQANDTFVTKESQATLTQQVETNTSAISTLQNNSVTNSSLASTLESYLKKETFESAKSELLQSINGNTGKITALQNSITNFVSNTDFASTEKAGVIKLKEELGCLTKADASGVVKVYGIESFAMKQDISTAIDQAKGELTGNISNKLDSNTFDSYKQANDKANILIGKIENSLQQVTTTSSLLTEFVSTKQRTLQTGICIETNDSYIVRYNEEGTKWELLGYKGLKSSEEELKLKITDGIGTIVGLDSIKTKVDNHESRISEISGANTTINGEIEKINAEISKIKGEVDEGVSLKTIKDTLDTLISKVEALEAKPTIVLLEDGQTDENLKDNEVGVYKNGK